MTTDILLQQQQQTPSQAVISLGVWSMGKYTYIGCFQNGYRDGYGELYLEGEYLACGLWHRDKMVRGSTCFVQLNECEFYLGSPKEPFGRLLQEGDNEDKENNNNKNNNQNKNKRALEFERLRLGFMKNVPMLSEAEVYEFIMAQRREKLFPFQCDITPDKQIGMTSGGLAMSVVPSCDLITPPEKIILHGLCSCGVRIDSEGTIHVCTSCDGYNKLELCYPLLGDPANNKDVVASSSSFPSDNVSLQDILRAHSTVREHLLEPFAALVSHILKATTISSSSTNNNETSDFVQRVLGLYFPLCCHAGPLLTKDGDYYNSNINSNNNTLFASAGSLHGLVRYLIHPDIALDSTMRDAFFLCLDDIRVAAAIPITTSGGKQNKQRARAVDLFVFLLSYVLLDRCQTAPALAQRCKENIFVSVLHPWVRDHNARRRYTTLFSFLPSHSLLAHCLETVCETTSMGQALPFVAPARNMLSACERSSASSSAVPRRPSLLLSTEDCNNKNNSLPVAVVSPTFQVYSPCDVDISVSFFKLESDFGDGTISHKTSSIFSDFPPTTSSLASPLASSLPSFCFEDFFSRFSPAVTALTCTRFELCEMRRTIDPHELIEHAVISSPTSSSSSLQSSVSRIVERFNRSALWIVESVLTAETVAERAERLQYWWEVARECATSKLGNTHWLVLIVSTLSSHYLTRLKGTQQHYQALGGGRGEDNLKEDELLGLVCPLRNFGRLRQWMRQHTTRVPYLGLVLRDLIHAMEGSPRLVRSSCYLNVSRLLLQRRIVRHEFTNVLVSIDDEMELLRGEGRGNPQTDVVRACAHFLQRAMWSSNNENDDERLYALSMEIANKERVSL